MYCAGRLGRIELDNTLTNFHSGWESRNSIFECKQQAGLYLFSVSARGRGNFGINDYISNGNSEEARRIRLHNLRSREADRDACFDWK